jgi:lipoprotein-anchoring transpeptidase ErfK/SrfK
MALIFCFQKIIRMFKGKSQVTSVALLGLSAIILILIHQQQAFLLNTTKGTAKISQPQPHHFLPFRKFTWPDWRGLSVNHAGEKIDPASLSNGTHLVIKLSDRRVYVFQHRKLKASYPVAIGKAGWETPIGNYKVMDMEPNPVWEHPWTGEIILDGPKNPLGARWIGFWTDGTNSIGFHGTPAEQLVGQAVSHGCVRMRNKDVIALYAQVKMGTPVTVKP